MLAFARYVRLAADFTVTHGPARHKVAYIYYDILIQFLIYLIDFT